MGPVAIPQHPSVSTLTPTTAPNFWAQQDANTQQAMQQLYSAGVQYTHGFPQNYIGNA